MNLAPVFSHPQSARQEAPMIEHPDLPDSADQMVLQQVIITRVMTAADIVDHVIAVTASGDEIGLAEALGMMRLAEDTLIRSRLDD